MRDVFAGIVAVALLLAAASLATTLKAYRRRLQGARDSEQARGRRIIAELPTATDLVLVSDDDACLYYGDRSIEKHRIAAVRVLINGAPIAASVSSRHAGASATPPTSFEDRPEGIARDRWDVAVELADDMMLIECGAIRERVSQELARTIFEAVKADIETRDRHAR